MKVEVGILFRVGAAESERVAPANGRKFELKELQKLVDGYIELVPHARPFAYCNEDGRYRELPLNQLASLTFNQVLVGDVVQVVKEEKA